MTQEAIEDLFDTHQKYVNAIQRLPLSPKLSKLTTSETNTIQLVHLHTVAAHEHGLILL
jgi:hypothetical protein